MSWFKENKFLAGLIAVTVALAAVIIFLGMKAGSSLAETQEKIASASSKLKKDKSLDPFPTASNAAAKAESVKAVIAKGNEVREKLLAFRPQSLADVDGKVFSESLSKAVNGVKELFPAEDALPNGFNLGFRAYRGSLPKEGSTGELTYQLGAMEYFFTQMAEAGVKEIKNVYREKIPAEKGKKWDEKERPSKTKRASRGGPVEPKFETLPTVARAMPFEVTFSAPEPVVSEFMNRIANSDQYFFETTLFRATNPAGIPSAGKPTTSAAADDGGDFGGGIEFVGGDEDEEEAVEATQILNKISGGENLNVFLRANLLLFVEEAKFPELK